VISNILILPAYPTLIKFVIPNLKVSENVFGIGIFIILCFLWVYLDFKNIRQEYKLAIIIFTILTIINLKMLFAIVPVLALATAEYFERINKYQKVIVVICYVCLFIGAINYSIQDFPSSNDYKMLEVARSQALIEDKELMVNWGYGYWAINQGVDSNYFGYYSEQDPTGKIYYTELTHWDKTKCKEIEKGKRTIVVSC
jgi:hypothetical protein